LNRCAVVGGGLAGLSAATALGSVGFHVDLFESRPFLGGRASSFPVNLAAGNLEIIDNCQHVLLRCCVNLIDLYRRLQVEDRIEFHRDLHFLQPGGRHSQLKAGRLPAPIHFSEAFARLQFLTLRDKCAIACALWRLKRERTRRKDLRDITMLDWLREKRQTSGAIERFWRPVLVSAVNEELDRMAAHHGFQVFWLGFLVTSDGYELGLPTVPLTELYGRDLGPNVRVHLRRSIESMVVEADAVREIVTGGEPMTFDWYISALAVDRLRNVAPALPVDFDAFEFSPITGVHLWFDRPVTNLRYAALLDRTIQWFFNKGAGRYLLVVVSASRDFLGMPRQDVIDLALRELAEFLPEVTHARVEKATVIKEARATYSASPRAEAARPHSSIGIRNLFLAGDWTQSGWPATMEGAVRSGYMAAEAVTAAAGKPQRFLLPDIA
jgi:zeta-carotene desaturase